ncbi:MAG TPA: alpha/beta fold hydrolase [Polyangiaceae bacterium]|nr:alpha/beta fold hydrolase [Polyangiaceae bacterium]
MINRARYVAFTCLSLVVACSSKSESGSSAESQTQGPDAEAPVDDNCPVVVKDEDCDKSLRPFVFVHGTYGSGDNFAHVAALLTSNGYCPDHIVAVEYNSLGDSPGASCDATPKPQGCGKIDAVVNDIMAKTGATQVDLAGHSQGTAHCGTYLADAGNAKKVAHYINFSGSPDVGDTPTLSLSSQHDLGNTPHHATGKNVTTFTLMDEDHFAVAASTRSFVQVYQYLTGNMPTYNTVQCGDEQVTIEGLAETFADNTPMAGRIEIRPIGTNPRDTSKPEVTVTNADGNGHFGPFTLRRNVPYEFRGFDEHKNLIGYQFFTPFKRSNRLVRLLSPAYANDGSGIGGTIAAASTDKIVHASDDVALVGRWAGGGFRQDLGASLKIDGTEILTDVTAGSKALANSNTSGGVVGLFMYDANQDHQTQLGMVDSGPFLMFTDVYMDASKPRMIDITFTAGSEDTNDTNEIKIPNWPSKDQYGNPVTSLLMLQ